VTQFHAAWEDSRQAPQGDDFCQASFESRPRGKLDGYENHTTSEGPVWVKPRPQSAGAACPFYPQEQTFLRPAALRHKRPFTTDKVCLLSLSVIELTPLCRNLISQRIDFIRKKRRSPETITIGLERLTFSRPTAQGSRLFARRASHCDCRYRPRDRHRAPATSLSTYEADQVGTSPQQLRGRRRAS
jgi:hypothetical protein